MPSIEKRFRRGLREAKPRPDDSVVLVARPDSQSLLALKLLAKIERKFPRAKLSVVEVAPPSTTPALKAPCRELGVGYGAVTSEGYAYTDLRRAALLALKPDDPLLVLPDTAEDLAAYLLGEVALGAVEGLELDARFRVAYPLARVSVRELPATPLKPYHELAYSYWPKGLRRAWNAAVKLSERGIMTSQAPAALLRRLARALRTRHIAMLNG